MLKLNKTNNHFHLQKNHWRSMLYHTTSRQLSWHHCFQVHSCMQPARKITKINIVIMTGIIGLVAYEVRKKNHGGQLLIYQHLYNTRLTINIVTTTTAKTKLDCSV